MLDLPPVLPHVPLCPSLLSHAQSGLTTVFRCPFIRLVRPKECSPGLLTPCMELPCTAPRLVLSLACVGSGCTNCCHCHVRPQSLSHHLALAADCSCLPVWGEVCQPHVCFVSLPERVWRALWLCLWGWGY